MAKIDVYVAHRAATIDMSKQGIKIIPCRDKEINIILKLVYNDINDKADEISSFSEALFEGLHHTCW